MINLTIDDRSIDVTFDKCTVKSFANGEVQITMKAYCPVKMTEYEEEKISEQILKSLGDGE